MQSQPLYEPDGLLWETARESLVSSPGTGQSSQAFCSVLFDPELYGAGSKLMGTRYLRLRGLFLQSGANEVIPLQGLRSLLL